MHTDLVLGIDGGGTKTQAAVADFSGRLLGMGQGGPSNYDDVGVEKARQGIAQAVQAACTQASLVVQPFSAAFLGLAGVVSQADREVIRGIAMDLRLAEAQRIGIDHDCRIALAGGLSGRPGIVLIAGTGSSCYGRTANGQHWRAGGWGHLIADEGSGYWLGAQAMRAAVMSYDGRIPATRLLPKVLAALQLGEMNEIMHRIYAQGLSRSQVAGMALLVIEAAQEGDALALDLIQLGAQDLAECVLATARRLGLDAPPGCEVALVGGLLAAGEIIQKPLREAIYARLPDCKVTLAELPPVLGACILALQSLGVSVADGPAQQLQKRASMI